MPDFKLTLLQSVRIASPCPMRWEDMQGDDKIRHCRQCDLHVHNLSAMTSQEAEELLGRFFTPQGERKGKRFCGTIRMRADGTIITRDCPVGLAALHAKARRAAARCVAAAGAVVACSAALASMPWNPWRAERLRDHQPFERLARWIDPDRVKLPVTILSGDIAMPTPPSPPTPPAPTPTPFPIPNQ